MHMHYSEYRWKSRGSKGGRAVFTPVILCTKKAIDMTVSIALSAILSILKPEY